MKPFIKIYRWSTATRLRKILSSILVVLILITSIRFIFIKPKEVQAADVYLSFDEGYGTTDSVHDTNGTISAGSITNAIWKSDEFCKYGKCLYFDGDGDYVSFADNSSLDFAGSDSGTLEGWFRHNPTTPVINADHETNDWSQYGGGVTNDGDMTISTEAALSGTTYGIKALINDTNNNYGNATITADTSGKVRFSFYFDPNSVTIPSAGQVLLMDNHYSGTVFGQVWVRYSGTEYQIFSRLYDDAGSSYNTSYYTISDAPHFIEYYIQRATNATSSDGLMDLFIDNSYKGSVTGKDNYDRMTSFTRVDFGSMTITAGTSGTIYLDELKIYTGTQVIISKNESTGADGGYSVYMEGDGDIACGIDSDNYGFPLDSVYSTSGNYDDNKWHHFACVKNGSTSLLLYLDGYLISTDSSITSSTLANDDIFYIGIDGDAVSNDYKGFIDEVVVSRAAKSADQIKSDFNAITPNNGTSAFIGSENGWLTNGLVGYWKMDESSWNNTSCGTTKSILDSSGNGINGSACPTTTGPTGGATGKFGYAGSFDGDDDYVDLGSSDTLWHTDQPRTVSFWTYLDGFTAETYPVVFTLKSNHATDGFRIFYNNSSSFQGITFGYDDTVYARHTDNYTGAQLTGSWKHVVLTYNGNGYNNDSNYKLFVDGVSQTFTGLGGGVTTPEQQNRIGVSNTSNFDGSIDEFRLYNRELPPSEVQKLYTWAPGPVAYWKLDENNGQNAYDSSGNGNTGTLGTSSSTDTSDPYWNSGKFGQALKFDGTNDYVNAGNGNSIQLGKTGTVSMWFKATTAFSGNTGTQKWLMDGGPREFYFSGSSSSLFYFKSDGTNINSDGSSWDTNWHHVAVTSDGTTVYMYIDGIRQTTSASLGSANFFINDGNLTISQQASPFPGLIDDVKIYNYARTQQQIMEDINASQPNSGSLFNAPIGYWNFDEGHGDTANNSGTGGNAINGNLAGAGTTCPTTGSCPTWTNSGKSGKALDFDGALASGDDYIDAGSDSSVDNIFSQGGTITAWIKPDSFGESNLGRIIDKDSKTYFYVSNDGTDGTSSLTLVRSFTGSSVWHASDNSIATGNWTHVAVVYDDSSVSNDPVFYINGVPSVTTEVQSGTGSAASDATGSLIIGNRVAGDRTFDGKIDDLKIYRAILTADQIRADYNQGTNIILGSTSTDSLGNPSWSANDEYCPPGQGTACTPPVAHWKFDENTGTSAYDISGNNLTGTLGDGTAEYRPVWTQAKIGSGLRFDGTDDVVTLNDNDVFSSGFITVEAWVKYHQLSTTKGELQYIIRNSHSGLPWLSFALYLDNTNPNKFVGSVVNQAGGTPQNIIGSTTAALETWYHVALTWDGSNINLYVNGIKDATPVSYTGTGIFNTDSTIRIGAQYSGGSRTDGIIDDVRFYNYARTTAQVAWDYDQGAPSGWWQTDESLWNGTAGEVKDNSGNDLHGVRSGDATTTTAGKYNNAGTFDGTDDVVRIAEGPAVDLGATTDSYSIAAWFKTSASYSNGAIVMKRAGAGGSTNPFELYIDSSNRAAFVISDTGSNQCLINSVVAVNDGNWHHAVGIRDTAQDKCFLYLDGKQIGSGNTDNTTTSAANNDDISIGNGGTSYTNYDFNGQIDDVRIYNYALTTKQIQNVMNAGSAVKISQ